MKNKKESSVDEPIIKWKSNAIKRRMPVVINRRLPIGKSYGAINLFGVLFAKRGIRLDEETINHELIHSAQMRELLWIPFYIIYFFEWLWRLVEHHGNTFKAYQAISFEREAYRHASSARYLLSRTRFAMWRSPD